MTPEVTGRGLVARQEVGWNKEWRAISGDSLAAAVYQTHKSRVAANAALEMGSMLAGGEIDLAELELVMEAAKKAAVEAGLAAGGDTGRDTDIRGFVSRFVPEQLAKIRRPFELESGAEQERQAQRYLVQTGLLMTGCFEPRLELDSLFNIRKLVPSLIEALMMAGLTDVPQAEGLFSGWSDITSGEREFLGKLQIYLSRLAAGLKVNETVFQFREIPLPGSGFSLENLFSGEIVYALAKHPGVRQKLVSPGQEWKLCKRLLVKPLAARFGFDYKDGAGPNGEKVEGFEKRGVAEGARIGKLFPDYPYRQGKYWSTRLFPYKSDRVPRSEVGAKTLSIYKFHLDDNLPNYILGATAAGGPEKLRMVLAGGMESYRRRLKEWYGMTVPETAIESDSRGLGRRLDEIGRRLGQDEEMINLAVMLWMLSDPLKIVENPGMDRIVDFQGDYFLFEPLSRFPAAVSDEAGREKWVVDKGDTPRVWVCLQIAKKLLPHLATLEQAEKEGRVDILSRLKFILKYPGTEVSDRLPQLKGRLDQWAGAARDGSLEEFLTAYQPDEQPLKALAEAGGVDLRMMTLAEIRRGGGCPTLAEAAARFGNEQSRKLMTEAILMNEFSLLKPTGTANDGSLEIGLGQMLNYSGEIRAEYLPGQTVNIRGRQETVKEAGEWLRQQPMRIREYIRYMVFYRLLQATAREEFDWPDNQSRFYREAARYIHGGSGYSQRYPAVGQILEYLSGLDSDQFGLTLAEVEQIIPLFGELGLPTGEWKYDKWWASWEAQKARRQELLAEDKSDWRKHPEWMNRFLAASYQVCELLTRKLQGEAVLAQAEKNFELGLENLAGLEGQIGVLDAKVLWTRFTEMRSSFSKLPAGSKVMAEVMKNVIGQLGDEGEKMRRARKSDEQVFEEWLKRVFIPLYKRSGGK